LALPLLWPRWAAAPRCNPLAQPGFNSAGLLFAIILSIAFAQLAPERDPAAWHVTPTTFNPEFVPAQHRTHIASARNDLDLLRSLQRHSVLHRVDGLNVWLVLLTAC